MTRKKPSDPALDQPAAMAVTPGPWDNPGGGSSSGQNDDGASNRPASPWLPPRGGNTGGGGDGGGGNGGPRRPGGFDDLLRKGPFGPKLPQVPGGANWVGLGLGALALLWLATTSFHVLESHEEGVVSTLGSYSRTVGPGFNITLPFPFQTMTKVPARRAQTENIPEGNAQNFVLTGDANIINLTYSVRWTIKDPEQYLYQLDDPRATIRDAAESAMRATIANFQLETAITSGKSDIEDQVKTRLQAILDGYRSGIRIEGVAVRDAVAPTEVAAAFERVNVARQRSQTYINQARAYRAEIVQRAEGEAQAFDALYEQYRQSPGVTRRRIYYETMERVLRRAEKTVVDSRGVTSVLPLPEARRTAPPPPPAAAAPARGGQ